MEPESSATGGVGFIAKSIVEDTWEAIQAAPSDELPAVEEARLAELKDTLKRATAVSICALRPRSCLINDQSGISALREVPMERRQEGYEAAGVLGEPGKSVKLGSEVIRAFTLTLSVLF